jgi:hypothetical protein
MAKTVKDAAKQMPRGTRKIFIKLWESVHVLDLYDGDLKIYLEVIQNQIENKNKKINLTENLINHVKKILE